MTPLTPASWARQTAEAQGLPPTVEDRAVLEQIAALVGEVAA